MMLMGSVVTLIPQISRVKIRRAQIAMRGRFLGLAVKATVPVSESSMQLLLHPSASEAAAVASLFDGIICH
jgi:hypothetical protein